MNRIKKIVNRDVEKRSVYEPFAGIHYDGSYPCAAEIINLVGQKNLAIKRTDDTYALIDRLMDDSSNLKMPEILGNEETGLIPCRPLTLKVGWWLVMEVRADSGKTEIVFYPEQQFNSIYEIVS